MQVPDSLVIPVVLNVDVGAQSSMFCCTVCLELIQVPNKHRQCGECGNTICTDCVKRLFTREKCPTCRKQTRFVINRLIHREIYPMVLKKCRWSECTVKMLHIDAHSVECEWRETKCPVCKSATPMKSIHTHLASKCKFHWGTAKRGTPEDFARELKNVSKSRKNFFRVFDLTPQGFDIRPEDARLIYLWRRTCRRIGPIRMMCIQLCAGPAEMIEFARSRDDITCMIPVQSIRANEFECAIIDPKEINDYSQIEIHPKLHSFTYGEHCTVNRANAAPITGVIVDFTWEPTSAVVIDARGDIIDDVDVSDIVRVPHQEQKDDVEPIVCLPEPDSLSYAPNAYPGSAIVLPHLNPPNGADIVYINDMPELKLSREDAFINNVFADSHMMPATLSSFAERYTGSIDARTVVGDNGIVSGQTGRIAQNPIQNDSPTNAGVSTIGASIRSNQPVSDPSIMQPAGTSGITRLVPRDGEYKEATPELREMFSRRVWGRECQRQRQEAIDQAVADAMSSNQQDGDLDLD